MNWWKATLVVKIKYSFQLLSSPKHSLPPKQHTVILQKQHMAILPDRMDCLNLSHSIRLICMPGLFSLVQFSFLVIWCLLWLIQICKKLKRWSVWFLISGVFQSRSANYIQATNICSWEMCCLALKYADHARLGFPQDKEEESNLPWLVAVFGPTSQKLLHSLSWQPSTAWQGVAFFYSGEFSSAKLLARQHLLVIISLNRLVVGVCRPNPLDTFPAWVTWPNHVYWYLQVWS